MKTCFFTFVLSYVVGAASFLNLLAMYVSMTMNTPTMHIANIQVTDLTQRLFLYYSIYRTVALIFGCS